MGFSALIAATWILFQAYVVETEDEKTIRKIVNFEKYKFNVAYAKRFHLNTSQLQVIYPIYTHWASYKEKS